VEGSLFKPLKATADLTVFPTDNSNATVALINTADYHKTAAHLEDQAYRKLNKQPTESTEAKPQFSRNPHFLVKCAYIFSYNILRLLDFMDNQRFTVGTPIYCLSKHLVGLLRHHLGTSLCHIKNFADFDYMLGSLQARPQHFTVSSTAVSLFSRVQIKALNLPI
jgi:hypothetical protein